MTLTINGESQNVATNEASITVQQLLEKLDLGYPVLVELNREALFARELGERTVKDGDNLELMRMVAGG